VCAVPDGVLKLKYKKMQPVKTNYHPTLASYFASKPLYLDAPTQKKPNTRKLVEQPWQQTKAEMWDEVTNTLCNLDFIQAKAAAKMTYELVNDFNATLKVIPDNSENIKKEKERQARMDKYTQDLIACAKGEFSIAELQIPESVTPWSKQQIKAEIDRINNDPSNVDRLKDFIYFLGQEADNLEDNSSTFANFAIQQAWNFANTGPVGKNAETHPLIVKSLIVLTPLTRPDWNPMPLVLKVLKKHTSWIRFVPITPNGEMALSCSGDNTCILWDLSTGKVLKSLIGHKSEVNVVSFTPDGKWAISGSNDKTCILWNLYTGESLKILKPNNNFGVHAVSITPDGHWAISDSEDDNCILWNLITGLQEKTLIGHTSSVNGISITPDGKKAISCSADNTCILWDLTTGELTKTLKGHSRDVTSVSITPDGKWAISGSKDYTCILWNLHTGEQSRILTGHTLPVQAVSITPDGKLAISGSSDFTCIFWNLMTGKEIRKLNRHTGYVYGVSITTDGKSAISGSLDKTCIQWNLNTFESRQKPKWHNNTVMNLFITTNCQQAISTSGHEFIHWDLITGMSIQKFNNNCTVYLSSNEKGSISNYKDGCLSPLKSNNVELIKAFKGAIILITSDGNRAINQSDESTCILWNLKTGKVIQKLDEHNSSIMALSITSDGKFAITGSQDKKCIVWDLNTGFLINKLIGHTSFVNAVSITPDGKMAISGSSDKTCIVWNIATGERLKTLIGHTDNVNSVSITPDGKKAISGSRDNTCIIWNLNTGVPLKILKGHTRSVQTVAITFDGKLAVSGSSDNSCIIWDIISGEKVGRFFSKSEIEIVKMTSERIILGGFIGEILILKIDKSILCSSLPIITIFQIWEFNLHQFQPFSADCPLCGYRFEPPKQIIRSITQILQEARIKSDQSPCLELPDEAWEHPGLIGECPSCHEKLKFNPFFSSDMNEIIDYYTTQEREHQFQKTLDEAEKAFNSENWTDAFNQLLNLVQQGKFDANDLRYKMALCRLNSLTFYSPEIISDINILIQLLQEKGANDKAQIIADKLKERLDVIKQEEIAKKKAVAPWWKKMFGN